MNGPYALTGPPLVEGTRRQLVEALATARSLIAGVLPDGSDRRAALYHLEHVEYWCGVPPNGLGPPASNDAVQGVGTTDLVVPVPLTIAKGAS